MESDALRDQKLLEFKCGKCERTITMIGQDRQEPGEAERTR
jgi:hypothetical protein